MFEKVLETLVGIGRVKIGLGVPVQFQLIGKNDKLRSTGFLAGMIPEEYLMVRVPAIPGILSRLSEGEPVVVRYIYEGHVYGFNSTILTFISKPGLMAFITYPDKVETMSLRETQRIPCCLSATIKTDGGEYRAVIVDISEGGSRVCLEEGFGESLSFDLGQTMELSFQFIGVAENQLISCTVRNLKRDAQLYEIGFQFDQENQAVLKKVKEYLDSLTIDSTEFHR